MFKEYNTANIDSDSGLEKERHAEAVLADLGLTWESLKGKRVLEIGAGLADFAAVAKEKGVDVVSLEKNPALWSDEGVPSQKTPYVIGDASKLPFQKQSFDIVISRAAPPIISDSKEEVEKVIQVVRDVLKDDGEFRFGPGHLNAAIFTDDELYSSQDDVMALTTAERMQRIQVATRRFLKSISDNIEEVVIVNDGTNTDESKTYYILHKSA